MQETTAIFGSEFLVRTWWNDKALTQTYGMMSIQMSE